MTNITLNYITKNKIKKKEKTYRLNNTKNLNLRTKVNKKNNNIVSITELSTLIRKKIKECSKNIALPKETNNLKKNNK